jgi:hypothetical protein
MTSGKIYTESALHHKIVEGAVHTAIIQTISTPWLRVDKEQGWSKIYKTLILGVFKSQHKIKLEVYYDYETYISETYLLQPLASAQYNLVSRPTNAQLQDGTKINGIYQMIIDMVRKNCSAFRIVITDVPEDVANNTGECFALSNITVTVGLKKGPAKLPASKSY